MNAIQKEIQQIYLNDEKKVLKDLRSVYKKALDDVNANIAALMGRTDTENLQATIYRLDYQKALRAQISGILDSLNNSQFDTISKYLTECYENGYIGAMYDLSKQGIPLVIPIDQSQVKDALIHDTKLSKKLYAKLGEDVDLLKRRIGANLSRGLAQGHTYAEISRNISGQGNIALNKTMRIARTEGHRITQQSTFDAQNKAKGKGANILKQWDATLDGMTRESHRHVDGEIRELDEKFSNGLMYPGDSSGGAAEVINCRCVLLQRARWALDDEELEVLKDRAAYFGLDKTQNFEDFKKKYLEISEKNDTILSRVLTQPIESSEEHYKELLNSLKQLNINAKLTYNPVTNHTEDISENEIIKALSGGDRTRGSCASVALAYIGQKQGWNVLDFRDGESRWFFSTSRNLHTLSEAVGLKVFRAEGACSITVGNRLLKMCESGKEYYLCVGRHAAIVRKTDGGILQYLELQSATRSGWINFNGNPRFTLKDRFGCTQTSSSSAYYDFMIDLNDSDFATDDFKSLLGYINTTEKEQRKGLSGTIK